MNNQITLRKTIYIFLSLFFAICLLVAMLSSIVWATPNAPGDLDTMFGNNGVVITDIDGNDLPTGFVLRSDGKYMVIAESDYFATSLSVMLLYNSDGTVDTSFGTNGIVSITSLNSAVAGQASSIALQADGKAVIAGYLNSSGNKNFAILRYQSDGSPDTGFGIGGMITTPVSLSLDDEASSVTIQANGYIVAAGNVGNNDFAVVRYQPDGSLDTTFGVGGIVTTNFGVEWANDVIIQADGKIVAAGRSSGRFGVVRYNADGSLDGSFGNSGIVSTVVGLDPFMSAYAVVQQPDGKLLVAGTGYNDVDMHYAWALVRYETDGSLDTTFGTNGIVKTDFGGHSTSYDLVLRPNGKIVVVGDGSLAYDSLGISIVQYNEDGSLDTSFGLGGIVHTLSNGRALDVIMQPDGKIVALSYVSTGGPFDDLVLTRYENVDFEIYLPVVINP